MPTTGSLTILNVDDNDAGRYAISRMLEHAGFRVTEASTGAEALKRAEELPAIILLDVNLPDINGFEVCHRLKSNPATRSIPVLHVSATARNDTDKVYGLQGGADGYLTQPVESAVLLAHIQSLLRSSWLERRISRVNRSLKALVYCNEALLRAKSVFDLIQEGCRILVEVAGYAFVCVASREPEDGAATTVSAKWGNDQGLSQAPDVCRIENDPTCCPMAEAIRIGKPFLILDMTTDSRCEPWRAEALKRGFASAFALPLFIGGDVWGAISILSTNTEGFDQEEISLLSDLANDISYGIESLQARERAAAAQEGLRLSEERYRRLFDEAPLIYVITRNEQGIPFISDCNEQFLRTVGRTRDEVLEKPLADFYSVDSRERLLAGGGYRRALTGEYLMGERELLGKDCSLTPTLLYTKPEYDKAGSVIGTRAMFVDITERKEAECQAAASEERFRQAFEYANIGVCLVDTKGRLFRVNEQMCEMLGYTRTELEGMTVNDVAHPEDLDLSLRFIERSRSGETERGEFEKRYIHKQGNVVWGKVASSLVKDAQGNPLYFISHIQDITGQKLMEQEAERLQKQLLQAQKMEAVGTLAGGIAHDFNNILQVVLGYSEFLLANTEAADTGYRELDKISQAGKRGADLVSHLLLFSRKIEPQLRRVNLNEEVVQMQKLLTRTIPKIIKIRLNLSGDLERVNADPSQIGQMLMNLAVNARDAMPDGGELTIETANVELTEDSCAADEARPGRYTMLTVSDTGKGMDDDTLSHIFEPFFTTKEVGKGTGLGLATVYGIIKQHNGHIQCTSEPGRGTTFKIYLPVDETPDQTETTGSEPIPQGGQETILLVDDEEQVRDLGTSILAHFGYRVISAGNGREALKIYQDQGDHISLVILDLVMPEMDGQTCLAEILRVNPKAKVLIASGFAIEPSSHKTGIRGAKDFVEKPYAMRKLLKSVRNVIDGD